MGGGPDQEHMLIILWDEEPKAITDEIRERFPYIKVTYFCLKDASKPVEAGLGKVDVGMKTIAVVFKHLMEDGSGTLQSMWLFKTATILVTLASLPPKPEDAPLLKLIHLFSAGVDHYLNHPIVKDTDIVITTSSGIHGPPIAEWTLMTTLVLTKHYNITYELQKKHEWGKNVHHLREGQDWVGKRVGIAGYGSIGRQVARVFHALGSTIVAYTASPRETPESRKDQGYIVPGTGDPDGTIPTSWFSGTSKSFLHTFLSQNLDALVITLPLTPATTHLFSGPEFAILSSHRNTASLPRTAIPFSSSSSQSSSSPQAKGCLLLNISRGPIIHQPSLITALKTKQIRGACLDVTDPEPLDKESELWDMENVVITPHVSALGVEYMDRAYDVLMVNLGRRERGEKLVNVVQRRRGY